jgi:hypothetical protein
VSFESGYRDYLIKQYWDKPKARAEIEMLAGTWHRSFSWLESFLPEFDVDEATGARLDVIGRVIGLSRSVPDVIAKIAFGFAENPNGRGFDDKFLQVTSSAPLQDKFEREYTALQLNDNDYRFFIKAKIAKNTNSGTMIASDRASIQDAITAAFSGKAYVIDKQDMGLILYISPDFNLDLIRVIVKLDLLPKPQGVQYSIIIQAAPGETFGFLDNPDALPFADKFDLINQPGGRLANKVI